MIYVNRDLTSFFCGVFFSVLICGIIFLAIFPHDPRIWTSPLGCEFVVDTDGRSKYHLNSKGRQECKTDFDPEQEPELGPEPVEKENG